MNFRGSKKIEISMKLIRTLEIIKYLYTKITNTVIESQI